MFTNVGYSPQRLFCIYNLKKKNRLFCKDML